MNWRKNIVAMLEEKDLSALLERAAEIHGHVCPGLAAGVKAAAVGCDRLNAVDSEGMEEVMAVVECNNCFVDGIQAVAGCTFGNNALVYRDLGKTAVTLYRRDGDRAVRLRLLEFSIGEGSEQEEAERLFEKAVKRRETLTDEEDKRFTRLWEKGANRLLETPTEEIFEVQWVNKPDIDYAPIFESEECEKCGEKVMESRIRLREGRPFCLECAGENYGELTGAGIGCAR
ncbi:MAG: FmdE family protein [Candidatus Brocadiia bacterium]